MTESVIYREDNEGYDCIECNSTDVYHDEAFGFYKCRVCRAMWGLDKDDPDYEEALYVAELPSEDDEYIADLMRREDRKEEEEANEDSLREYESQLENF